MQTDYCMLYVDSERKQLRESGGRSSSSVIYYTNIMILSHIRVKYERCVNFFTYVADCT